MKNPFGPLKCKDPRRALLNLLQLGTVKDYQREFEKLMNRVTDMPDSFLISFYILGLKLNLQHELLVSRPTMLGPIDEVHGKFAAYSEDKGCVEKVLGLRNVTPWAMDGGRRKKVKCYVKIAEAERVKRLLVAAVGGGS
nr:hypothetical protein [Tanacetum cinerariifolium]